MLEKEAGGGEVPENSPQPEKKKQRTRASSASARVALPEGQLVSSKGSEPRKHPLSCDDDEFVTIATQRSFPTSRLLVRNKALLQGRRRAGSSCLT